MIFYFWGVTRVRMRRLCRKVAIALLLGGYLLAVTVGGAFHTHSGQDYCTAHSDTADDCHGHACRAGHTHPLPVSASEIPDSPALEAVVVPFDPHCLICSFLSQKPIPIDTDVSESSAELEQPLVRVRAVPPQDDIPSTVFGRGPPSVA